ncbi:hypothetical protein [Streptomyces sp. NPDC048269]|uniref:hypothetical protein n=1 Tax=Streptomyces sp. NPDC048269 TaxID=3155753 RepID=UPI0034471C80
MTSPEAPSAWTQDQLTDLHRTVLWALLRYVSPPPGAGRADAGRPVRGVLQPPGPPEVTRVVLWDGHDLDTSVAYDLPLVDDEYDTNIPWTAIAGMLRRLAAGPGTDGSGAACAESRDGLGILVVDARAEAARFRDDPSYDRTDALHAAVSVLRPSVDPEDEPEPELMLGGFLLTGPDTVRLYVDRAAGPAARIGLDVALRDEEGRVRGGYTALTAALPSLVRDELEWNASEAEDPYCAEAYDFTRW